MTRLLASAAFLSVGGLFISGLLLAQEPAPRAAIGADPPATVGADPLPMPPRPAAAPMPPAAGPAAGPRGLGFYYEYVPQEIFNDVNDRARTIAMRREEFLQHLATLRQAAGGAAERGPSLVAARYSLRMSDGLLAGTAELEVRQAGPPGLLSLAGLRAAVSEVTWKDEPARTVTFGAGSEGQPAVLVEKPGRLLVTIALRLVRDKHGDWEAPLSLPAAPVQKLLLDLPSDLTLLAAGSRLAVQRASEQPPARTPPETRWQIDVTGGWSGRLRLVRSGAMATGHPPILAQSTAYLLSRRSGEVTSRLRLTPRGAWPAELPLTLDPGLELASAALGDRLLPVARDAAAPGGGKGYRLALGDLPDSPVELVLAASTDVTVGKPWKLPALRVGGVAWQEESFVVSVQAPLVLVDLAPEKAALAQAAELATLGGGETLELRATAPDARAGVTLAERKAQWQIQSATQVAFSSATTRGTQTLSLTASDGELFSFQTDLSPSWVLDAVEATPPELLDDWELTAGGEGGRLSVSFRRGIGPARSVRLTLRAHRAAAPTQAAFGSEYWHICRLSEAAAAKQRVALIAEPPLRGRLVDESGLVRLDPAALSPAEAILWSVPPHGILFADEPRLAGLRCVLDVEPPRFAAEITSELILQSGRQATERHTVRCVPEGTPLRRVYVQIAPDSEDYLHWTLGPEHTIALAARRLTVDEQQALGLSERGEVWEVAFPEATTTPLGVRGERRRAWTGPVAAPLATVPFASAQSGRVAIRVPQGIAPAITARGLEPLPLPVPALGELPAVAGLFRFEPARDTLAAEERSALVAAPGDQPGMAHCWSADLATWATPDDEWRHTVSYLLESAGAEKFRFALPPTGVLRRVWVQGELEGELPSARAGGYSLALPLRARYVRVDVEFTTPGQDLAHIDPAACWPPAAGEDRRSWSFWLPHEWRLAEPAVSLAPPRDDWAWRLFGSWARRPDDSALGLVARGGWGALVPGAPPPDQAVADALLDQLALAGKSRPGAWGPLMRKLGDHLRAQPADPANLWIDAAALAEARLSPAASLPAACDDRTQAAALLRRAGLVLDASPRGWVLTTADRPGLGELRSGCVQPLPRAELPSSEFQAVPASLWTTGRTREIAPWLPPPVELHRRAAGGTWHGYTIDVPPATLPAPLSAAWLPGRELGSWLVWLLACGLAWALPVAARPWTAAAAVVAATATLLLPHEAVIWATGLWQGLSLGLLAALFLAPPPPAGEATDSTIAPTPASGVRLAAVAILLLACLARSGDEARADEPPAPAPPPAKLHRVLVKVDAQNKPVDAYVHLPVPFYDELLRAAKAARTPAESFLLTDARYTLRVEGDAAAGDVESVRLHIAWEIETLRSDAKVVLAFPLAGLQLVDNGAQLDNHPIALDWRQLTIAEPGRHHLELTLRPTLVRAGGRTEFTLPIPPTPRAKAEVQLKPPRQGLEIDALGSVTNVAAGSLRADIGGLSTLNIRWRARDATPGGLQAEVEQLAWLRLLRGTAVLDVRWRVRGTELPEKLAVVRDPRLKRLGMADAGSEGVGSEQVEVLLTPAGEGEATAAATFLVSGMTGIGHIRPPHCRPSELRVATDWLAVSADSSLTLAAPEAAPIGPPAAALLPAARFSGRWPTAEPAPGIAIDLAAVGDHDWRLAAAPRAEQTTATLATALSFGDDRTDAVCTVDLDVAGGPIFLQRIKAPATLRVQSVSAADPDRDRACRWTRGPDGTILVLFADAVSGSTKLTLVGELPAAPAGRVTWPEITLPDATLRGLSALAYRQHERTVAADEKEGWRTKQPAGAPPLPGRFVAAWQGTGPAARVPLVTLGHAETKMHARLLTQLVRSTGSATEPWLADTLLEIDVRQGQLDQLRLEVAPRLAAGLSLEPPLPVEIVPWPDENLSRLIITPATPIRGVLRLRLKLPAPLGLNERPRVPEINVLGTESLERYLAAPAPYDVAPLAGDTRLEPGIFPAGLLPSTPPPAGGKSYKVVSPRYTAGIVRVERPAGKAQVRLADVRAAWSAGGDAVLLAALDLEPAGMTGCVIVLPSGQQLLGVQLDGVPCAATPAEPDRFAIDFGARQLPLRIEVMSRAAAAPLSSAALTQQLAAPSIADVPVLQTAWTIYAPEELAAGRLERHEQQVAARRLEWARLAAWAAIVDLPADSASEYTSGDMAHWYLPWARRIGAAQGALGRLQWTDPEWSAAETSRLETFKREQVQLASRLGVTGVQNQVTEEPVAAAGPTRWWPAVIAEGSPVTRLLFKGEAREVQVAYGPAGEGLALGPWLLGALGVVLVLAGGNLVWAKELGWLGGGLAAGVMGWAFLTPAWIGLVLLGVVLAAWVRRQAVPVG